MRACTNWILHDFAELGGFNAEKPKTLVLFRGAIVLVWLLSLLFFLFFLLLFFLLLLLGCLLRVSPAPPRNPVSVQIV